MLKEVITAPVSWIYGLAVKFRNKLFDWGILKSEEFDIPIISVGNLTVGGTGKTPHTEYIVKLLKDRFNVAVVSRGYKRRTKGFLLVTPDMSYLRAGDEPKQIKLKFPDIPVAVSEKRAEGIKKLREMHPEVNLIILDDAFQHRYVDPWVSILLMDYNRPVYRDHFLPWGRLRDSVKQLSRAQLIIMTKCPDYLKPIDIRVAINNLNLYPYQTLYFTKFRQSMLVPIFPDKETSVPVSGHNIIAMAGVANPKSFFQELEAKYNVLKTMSFPDHYSYKVRDLDKMKRALADTPDDTIIVVTEKDAVKLTNAKKIPAELQRRLYYIPIEVAFLDGGDIGFKRQLEQYVKTNHKYNILHPE